MTQTSLNSIHFSAVAVSRCLFRSALVVIFMLVGLAGSSSAQETWTGLFEDDQFSKWSRLGKEQGVEAIKKSWKMSEDGWLHLYKPAGHGSSLLMKEDIGDFELSFYWKIKTNANNGVKYRVKSYEGKYLGIEYQLLDDDVRDGKTIPKHRTASIYDIFAPATSKKLNAPGEVNHTRIKVRNGRLEHWLNGELVASADTGSQAWDEGVAKSKFKPHEGFGENRRGRILFTDHGGEIWFKDVMLKRFEETL